MISSKYLWICGLVLLIALSCSKTSGPISPSSPNLSQSGASLPSNNPTATGHHDLWGFYQISIDAATEKIDIVPLRGAMFNANVTRFLQPPSSPIHLLTVSFNSGSDFLTGHLDLNVTLRHPFPGLNKFRGFDVRGIVMGEGSVPFTFDQTVYRAAETDLQLENADGWTRWWNPTEFTTFNTILGYTPGSKSQPGYFASASINPYKYFADDLESDSPLPDLDIANRGSFSTSPGINTRRYVLQFPSQPGGISYKFNYAIDASWASPDPSYDPDYPVEAYPIEANMPESWRTIIDTSGTTAWYVNDLAKGGSIQLSVEVFDWQGSTASNGVADEVSAIYVDCPLFTKVFDLKSIASSVLSSSNSSTWVADISDIDLTSSGVFDCWVAVESSSPANYAPQIQGDISKYAWPDAPIRSYWHGPVKVSPDFPSDAPVVLKVGPAQGLQSTVLPEVNIVGLNFQAGANVEFKFDTSTSLPVSNIVWVDNGLITCDLDCSGPLGFYDVTVTNPDTQQGTLDDCFEVIKPSEESIWWKCHMYNSQNIGRNPTVPGADPTALSLMWSSPVSGDKKYTTPVVADDKIFFTGNDGFYSTDTMTIHCFDLITGLEIWSNPINPSYANARAFGGVVWWAGPDGIDRVAIGGDQVYCYNADTGKQLWSFDDVDNPAVCWVSNQMHEYNGMVLARSRSQNLYVLDFITGNLVSTVVCTSASEGGCGAKDGKVYISSNYYLDCADILTGEILWSTLLTNSAQTSHWINPTLVGNRCYVSTYQGYVFCIATEDDGTHAPGDIIWDWNDPNIGAGSNPLVGGTSAVVIGGVTRLFVAAAFSGNYVYCISDDGDTASTLWQSDKTGYYDSSPVWSSAPSYPEGVVYCPNEEGTLDAFDASNGHNIWAYSAGTELRAGVSPILDMLVVTSGSSVSVFKGP
jgi:outer membrane protein assembly factor BamB